MGITVKKKPAMKQDPRWPEAHERLKDLFAERSDLSQEDFGQQYGIGSQGMVWQYLNGYTPLNIEAAAKFARGLHCTIRDISPEMADYMSDELVPILGKRVRKAAMVLLSFALISGIYAPQAEAKLQFDISRIADFSSPKSLIQYTLYVIRRWLRKKPSRCFAVRDFLTVAT